MTTTAHTTGEPMALKSPAMILAAQGPQLCSTAKVGRSTAPNESGPDTAAALCGGVRQTEWAAARLVWAMDARDSAQLERLLYLRAIDLSIDNGWPKPPRGSERIRRMVQLAMLEHMNPGSVRVPTESGRRVLMPWSGELRSLMLDMQPHAFRLRWAKCYEEIYQHLGEWVHAAARRIRCNAIGDEE